MVNKTNIFKNWIHLFYSLAAEQALAATTLKKPESTPRGSHSSRAVRGGGGGGVANRGSKFLLFCWFEKKNDNYLLRMKLRLI